MIDPENTETTHPADEVNTAEAENPAPEQAEVQDAPPAAEAPDEWKDRYTRLAAEFDNFRRRTNREKDDLVQNGNVPLLKAIIPLMDDLERALKVAETAQDVEALSKGIQLMHKNLKNTLDKQGVEAFESLHQPFDSSLHEAIASMPAPQDDLKGKVIDEIEKGYRFRDKIIRYARVVTGE